LREIKCDTKTGSSRYIVHDVDAAILFYPTMLEFRVEMHPAAEFAIVLTENLRLLQHTREKWRGGSGNA
jgi:hypothetical protein